MRGPPSQESGAAAGASGVHECPLHTLDTDQDLEAFCSTDFCISLGKFKFGSRKAIEGFAQSLAQNIWHVFGDEIAADPSGWLICAPAYRFVPVSAVLLSRRVHELLVDRCAAASKAPALVELYRETITGVDYASLTPTAREKALPSYSIRGVPDGFVRGKRVVAIDDTRMYAAGAPGENCPLSDPSSECLGASLSSAACALHQVRRPCQPHLGCAANARMQPRVPLLRPRGHARGPRPRMQRRRGRTGAAGRGSDGWGDDAGGGPAQSCRHLTRR